MSTPTAVDGCSHGQLGAAWDTGRAPAASDGPSELFERTSQLAVLAKALMAVQESSVGQMVLVAGEAGIGKTALLQRFGEMLDQSVRLLRSSCDPLFAPLPLGPLLAIAGGVQGELKQVVGTGAAPPEVALALATELRSISPTVFILEDLHWADEATLDVLMLLARRVETVPVLIVASYRDEGLDRAHPLRRLLGEFATRRSVQRLQLAPLSAGAVSQLARPHGADPIDLYAKTAGNPFFVVEALASGFGEIPLTVRDAVLARVAPLSVAARGLLEAVSVIPQRAEFWLLEALVGGGFECLDECVTSGMLVAEAVGVAFRHELARLAVWVVKRPANAPAFSGGWVPEPSSGTDNVPARLATSWPRAGCSAGGAPKQVGPPSIGLFIALPIARGRASRGEPPWPGWRAATGLPDGGGSDCRHGSVWAEAPRGRAPSGPRADEASPGVAIGLASAPRREGFGKSTAPV